MYLTVISTAIVTITCPRRCLALEARMENDSGTGGKTLIHPREGETLIEIFEDEEGITTPEEVIKAIAVKVVTGSNGLVRLLGAIAGSIDSFLFLERRMTVFRFYCNISIII